MERKIIFRGKTKRRHRWVYGALLRMGEDFAIINQNEDDANYGLPFYVEKDTIGQFTGMVDKNGKKIFEGDIVEFSHPAYKRPSKWEVYWDENEVGFALRDGDNFNWLAYTSEFYEVLGNIYDKPELLRGKK